MRWLALAALLCLPSVGAAGAWHQDGGDPGRSGAVDLPDGDLDVLASANFDFGSVLADTVGAVVATPFGPVGLRLREALAAGVGGDVPFATCGLVVLQASNATPLGGEMPCAGGARLVAYDAAREQLILCIDGAAKQPPAPGLPPAPPPVPPSLPPVPDVPEPPLPPRMVLVRASDGGIDLDIPLVGNEALASGTANQGEWFCNGVLDEALGRVVLGVRNDAGHNRVLGFDLASRSERWSTTVLARDFAPVDGVPERPEDRIVTNGAFVLAHLTLTDTGVVITGRIGGDDDASAAVVFLDGYGAVRGGVDSASNAANFFLLTGEVPPRAVLSREAVANRNLAAYGMRREIFLVDPGVGSASGLASIDSFSATSRPARPVWSRDVLLVPFAYNVYVFDAQPGPLVSMWHAPSGGTVTSLVADEGGDVYALSLRAESATRSATLHRFEPRAGHSVQDLPLAGILESELAFDATLQTGLLPLGNGLLAWTGEGDHWFLGVRPEQERPNLDVPTKYPDLGKPLRLQVSSALANAVITWTVAWGDGTVETYKEGVEIARAYPEAGDYTLRVTAVYADGSTSTASMAIHPGRQPDDPLTPLQRAFAPKYQNWTFFVLGLFITLLGAMLAIAARRRGQSRIHAELTTLDQIAAQGLVDPLEARRDLDDFERRLRERLASGSLLDTQYDILDRRARDVRRDLERPRRRSSRG